jgi:hypothetical protein
MQSKQQRLYHEQNNKERVRQELVELSKQIKDLEEKTISTSSFDPHKTSYYN